MRNRDRQINIRLSEPEFNRLIHNAEKANLSVSTYLRSLIEGNSPKENPPLAYYQLMNKLEWINDQFKDCYCTHLSGRDDSSDLLDKNMLEYRKLLLEIQAAVLLPEKIKGSLKIGID